MKIQSTIRQSVSGPDKINYLSAKECSESLRCPQDNMEHSFLSDVMGTFISCLSVYLSVREREYAPGPRRTARFQWLSRTYRTSRTSRIQWNTRYPGVNRSTGYERFTRTARATGTQRNRRPLPVWTQDWGIEWKPSSNLQQQFTSSN